VCAGLDGFYPYKRQRCIFPNGTDIDKLLAFHWLNHKIRDRCVEEKRTLAITKPRGAVRNGRLVGGLPPPLRSGSSGLSILSAISGPSTSPAAPYILLHLYAQVGLPLFASGNGSRTSPWASLPLLNKWSSTILSITSIAYVKDRIECNV
jgi:hypothetical protein